MATVDELVRDTIGRIVWQNILLMAERDNLVTQLETLKKCQEQPK